MLTYSLQNRQDMPPKKIPLPNASAKLPSLTRQERKAQTRAHLIQVGRQHILKHGVAGAAADRISKEAGFTRGAFYLNFDDVEDLFIAVLHQEQQERFNLFRSLLDEQRDPAALLTEFRKVLIRRVTDPEWIVLQAELEAGALRSKKLSEMYAYLYRMMLTEGRQLLRKLTGRGVRLTLQPNEFLVAMLSFTHGIALNQRLLKSDLSQKSTRKVIGAVVNRLLTTGQDTEEPARTRVRLPKSGPDAH